MKKIVIFVVCLWSVFFCGGCITFRIVPLYPFEGYVESLSLCEEIIEKEGELPVPVDIRTEFSADEDHLFCFLVLKNIDRKIHLRWKWYAPGEALFRESENAAINKEAIPLETLFAYDELRFDLQEKETITGVWTVVVLLDNQVFARRLFEVK